MKSSIPLVNKLKTMICKTYFISLPPSQEPNMDPIPKATMIHPTSA
jgi:hypothetical protein